MAVWETSKINATNATLHIASNTFQTTTADVIQQVNQLQSIQLPIPNVGMKSVNVIILTVLTTPGRGRGRDHGRGRGRGQWP